MATATAKRLGWNERLRAGDDLDLEPYGEHEYPSDDLSGPLERWDSDVGPVVLVGGQEADPDTVVVVDDASRKDDGSADDETATAGG